MPPRRPSAREKAADPSASASAANSTQLKPSPFAQSPAEEEWSAPMSEESPAGEASEGYDDSHTPRGDATRVGPVVSEPDAEDEGEERSGDEDDNGEATHAGPPVSLEIIEGPDEGKKKRFKGVRMVLGRAKDIDITLSDQSVSRRHLELVLGETGVVLRDLGSGNGTRVNDEKVDEKVLQHGDVIALGKTRIRLVDEQKQIEQLRAEAAAREEAEKKKKEEAAAAAKKAAAERTAGRADEVDPNDPRLNESTVARFVAPEGLQDGGRPRPARGAPREAGIPKSKLVPAMLIGLVGVLFLGLLLMVGRTGGSASADVTDAPQADSLEARKEAKAQALMQQAWNALRSDDFAEAARLAEQADKILPGTDKDNLAKSARNELALKEGLAEVAALMEANNFEEARARFKALPLGTAKSDEARKKVATELDSREATFYAQQVLAYVEQRDVESARVAISKLPIAQQGAYLGQVARLEQELAREAADAERQARVNKVVSAKRAQERRVEFIAEAFSEVERKFHGGDYRGAALGCDRVVDAHRGDKDIKDRARQLKRLIPQFQLNFEDAQKKFKSNAIESAARPLRKAAALYQQIGFGGSLEETINEQLASASLAAGKGALARNDIAAAGSFYREAVRLNPGDSRAQAGLDSLRTKVEELYLQAYILKDRDPAAAAEKFRIVIEAAAEGSQVKEKAEAQLSAMQP